MFPNWYIPIFFQFVPPSNQEVNRQKWTLRTRRATWTLASRNNKWVLKSKA